MSFEGPFDWRGFWADLLGGAGRGLLELDNSDVARAALTSLDFMEAARRHRWGRASVDSSDVEHDLEPAKYRDAGDRRRPDDAPGNNAEDDLAWHQPDDRPTWRSFDRAGTVSAGLAPSVRPAPLSADPYDDLEAPARLRTGRYRYLRRR